jgi:4-amino-4-deoxy-L-arabinose transferase-like glycosyltransferase
MSLTGNIEDLSSGAAGHQSVVTPRLLRDNGFKSVLLISAISVLLCLAINIMNPPLDGDSYEYAGVAADLVEHGQLRMNHVGVGYHVFGQKIHQPAWNRATLWTFIIAPFHAVIGASYLCFLIPYIITLFLLAPTIYVFARKYFGANVAFCASVATLLNPRIIHWSISEDPGQPEALIIILSLCAIGLFMERKYIASGAAVGLILLTRMIGLLFFPPLFLWTLLFRRRDYKTRNILLFILAFILVSSPLLIRNRIVFGKYLYNDQATSVFRTGEQLVDLARNPNVFDKLVFKYRFPEEFKKPRIGFTPRQFMDFTRENAKAYIFGYHNGVAWYPGIIGLLSPLMIPFLLIGAIICLREPKKAMMVIFSTFFLFAMIVFRWTYEDRYIFSTLPFFIMIAFYGAQEISKKIKMISPAGLLIVFIVVEVFPSVLGSMIMLSEDLFEGAREPRYSELNAICKWVKAETPDNAVMMTIPFWSPQYLCSRPTVPPATGGMDIFKTVADEYSVDYFMFTEYWGGDRFPRLSFMEPVIRGKYISLYRLDRNHPDYRIINTNKYYMSKFDYLSYFWKEPLKVKVDLQPLFTFPKKYGSINAAILYIAVCLFIFWVSTFRYRFIRLTIYVLTALTLFALITSVLASIGKNFNLPPPPICKAQVEMFFRRLKQESHRDRIVIVSTKKTETSRKLIYSSTGIKTDVEKSFAKKPHENGTVFFVPVEEKNRYLTNIEDAENSFEEIKREKASYNDAANLLKRKGLYTEIVSGGVFGYLR